MSKNFFELFSKYNPLKSTDAEKYPLEDHIHSFYKGPQSGAKFVCTCGASMSNDEVFETDSSTSLKELTETEAILEMLDELSKNPPMRGDLALLALRRKITGEDK